MEISFFDLLDIAVMSFLIYTVLAWFKKTKAAFVLTGILIMAGFYLLARQFNLYLTASVFQGFFAVILVAVVVIFQEELRHIFERVAIFGLRPRFGKQKPLRIGRAVVATLVRTLNDFSKENIGALIVIRGRDLIQRHLEGGEELNGNLSESLLKSIFDPHSEGHDGAMVIEEDRVTYFGSQLPLSKDFKKLGKGGTRHAAALGLSELTDALCLVVSEETGAISVARHGELEKIENALALNALLEKFYREIHPGPKPATLKDFLVRNYREKLMAVGIAGLLWFLHVYGSKMIYKTFEVSVEYSLPKDLVVSSMEPKVVEVTFSGPRRNFYLLNSRQIRLTIKTWQIEEGVRIKRLSASDFEIPKNISIVKIEPNRINLSIEKKSPPIEGSPH